MKKTIITAAALILALVMAGCANQSQPAEEQPAEQPVEEQQEQQQAQEPAQQQNNQQQTQKTIPKRRAMNIALRDAGLKRGQVNIVKNHLDRDDGMLEYEIEFYKGNMEYEYTVDAVSGAILEKDFEQNNGYDD